MTMKKIGMYTMLAGVALLSSCEKDPDLGEMDGDFVVYTQYDAETDFANASTYYLPDSILTAGQGMQAAYWSDENADALLAQVERTMDDRGYTRSTEKRDADLGIQVTYLENTVNMVGFTGGYWDGWWDPYYWGPYWGGGWYYPFPITYQYNTGNIVLEMVDLRTADNEANASRLPIVWLASSEGMIAGNTRVDMMLVQRAIAQSFNQSPYINRHINEGE